MQALVKGLQSGGTSLGKLLPALGAAASARITTTAAAPGNQTPSSAAGTAPLEREFQIYRWHPEEGGKPKYQSYQLDLNECAPKMRLNTSPALSSLQAPRCHGSFTRPYPSRSIYLAGPPVWTERMCDFCARH